MIYDFITSLHQGLNKFLDNPLSYFREILILGLMVLSVSQGRIIQDYESAPGIVVGVCTEALASCVSDIQALLDVCAPERGESEMWFPEQEPKGIDRKLAI